MEIAFHNSRLLKLCGNFDFRSFEINGFIIGHGIATCADAILSTLHQRESELAIAIRRIVENDRIDREVHRAHGNAGNRLARTVHKYSIDGVRLFAHASGNSSVRAADSRNTDESRTHQGESEQSKIGSPKHFPPPS